MTRSPQRYGVDADRIATGCGSVALAEHLVRATCLPGDEVLYSWRSFEAYPIIVATSGATSVRVPNDAGHGHDLAAMAAAVTDRTRVILVCNPNNPTGTALRRAELDRFLDAVPDDVLVVIDEAYREFVTDPEVPDGLRLPATGPTWWCCAPCPRRGGWPGCGSGCLVAQPVVAAAVRKVVDPVLHQHGGPGRRAGRADPGGGDASAAAPWSSPSGTGSPRRCASFVPDVPTSQANFVWLPLGERAVAFGKACEARGVIVRPFAGDGVRVTIGTPAENDAFLAAAEAALA